MINIYIPPKLAKKETIKALVGSLEPYRAQNIERWLEVGRCLHNIDANNLLDVWIEFSKNADSFKEGECEKLWETFTDTSLGIGSLYRWASLDIKEDKKEEVLTYKVIGITPPKTKNELIAQITALRKTTLNTSEGLDILIDTLDLQPDQAYQAIVDKLDFLGSTKVITPLGRMELKTTLNSCISALNMELSMSIPGKVCMFDYPVIPNSSFCVLFYKDTKMKFIYVNTSEDEAKIFAYDFYINDNDVIRELQLKIGKH